MPDIDTKGQSAGWWAEQAGRYKAEAVDASTKMWAAEKALADAKADHAAKLAAQQERHDAAMKAEQERHAKEIKTLEAKHASALLAVRREPLEVYRLRMAQQAEAAQHAAALAAEHKSQVAKLTTGG